MGKKENENLVDVAKTGATKAPKEAKESNKKEKPQKPQKAPKPAKAPKPKKPEKVKKAKKAKQPMTKKKKVATFAIVGTIVMILIAALVMIYILGIVDKLFDSRIDSMNELAEHDANSINEFINNSWSDLELTADELVVRSKEHMVDGVQKDFTLRECLEFLNVKRANSNFDKLYLFTEDKANYYYPVQLYSDTYVLNTQSDGIPFIDEGYVDIVNRKPSRFVVKYLREDTWTEDKTDALYYGVMLNNSTESNKLRADGVDIVAIMARMDLTSIQEKIKIDCFDGHGYTSVIETNGDYIASVYGVSAVGKKDNYFDLLSKSTFDKSSSLGNVNDVKEAIKDGESFQIVYTDNEGVEKVATSVKLQDVDWTVVMTVEKEVFDSQVRDIVSFTSYFMLGILIAFLLIVIVASVSAYSGANTRAEVKARNDFMAIMSHEIRTPLNAIIGYNRLARININDKDKMKEYLQKEGESSDYLLGLLNDILDLSEMQDSAIQLNEKPASIENIIYSVIGMQRTQITKKGLKFGAKKNLITPYINCDENRMKQVIMNIMSNAVKFTDQGQIFMAVNQEKVDDEHVQTTFKISDTGCGMTPEMQKKIFESFSQDRNNNTMCLKGTGLGMAINKMIVDAVGGTISVESEVNKGSTFTVSWVSKVCSNSEIYEYKKSMHIVNNEDQTKQMHVFIVEDNELNAEILTEILKSENFKVTHAEDGAKAIELFAKSSYHQFDVILMDIRMPVMDGFQATRGIRALPREDAQTIPIFACTANAFEEDKEEAFSAGMDDFLTKPIDVTQMLTKLQNLANRRK